MRPYTHKVMSRLIGVLLFCLSTFMSTIRTDSPKKNIVPREGKAHVVPYVFLKTCDKIHVHIKQPTAFFTLHMAVVVAKVVIVVCTARDFYSANLACLGKLLEIAEYRRPAHA